MQRPVRALVALLALVIAASSLSPTRARQAIAAEATADKARIDRLAALARLWGVVKYFHPALASDEIDWDAALVAAIPKVRAAKSTVDYGAAVAEMLAVLKDPRSRLIGTKAATSIAGGPSAPIMAAAAPGRAVMREQEGAVVIPAAALLAEHGPGEPSAVVAEMASSKARGVVIDMRPAGAVERGSADMRAFLLDLLPRLFHGTVTLGANRYRLHHGYPPQRGMSTGGYTTSLVTDAPQVLIGRAKAESKAPYIAVIVAAEDPSIDDILVGMRAANRIQVVVDDRDAIGEGIDVALADGLRAFVAIDDVVAADGTVGLIPDARAKEAPGEGDKAVADAVRLVSWPPRAQPARAVPRAVPVPARDKAYGDKELPDAEHRLLALFRLWNVTHYFFPYLEVMERSWGASLTEFIPRFESAATAADYQLAIMEITARLQDTHVVVHNATAAEALLGDHVPTVVVETLDGHAVVRAVLDPDNAAGVAVGDVILSVDGESLAARRLRLGRLVSASTPQSLDHRIDRMLLRGPKERKAALRVLDSRGRTSNVELERTRHVTGLPTMPRLRRSPEPFAQLTPAIGYIDPGRVLRADADKALDALMAAPAIILDMRGQPDLTASALAPRLVKREPPKPIAAAVLVPPIRRATFLSPDSLETRLRATFEPTLPHTMRPRYQGRVLVLIDAHTISQGEHACLLLAAATDITFVGSPTSGAIGDVTNMVLPGNLVVTFSGQEVRFADGRPLQRVGIKPRIQVQPTIAGVRAARDEVLDAAMAHLRKGGGRP